MVVYFFSVTEQKHLHFSLKPIFKLLHVISVAFFLFNKANKLRLEGAIFTREKITMSIYFPYIENPFKARYSTDKATLAKQVPIL